MTDSHIADRIRSLCEPVIASHGLELLEVECLRGPRRTLVRLTLDHLDGMEGVTINECTLVSRLVGTILEVEDVIPGAYTLEVTSPGIERPLREPRDFKRFVGKRAKVQVEREPPGPGQPARVDVLSGIITSPDGAGFVLVLDKGDAVQIAYARMKKANLEFRFEDGNARR